MRKSKLRISDRVGIGIYRVLSWVWLSFALLLQRFCANPWFNYLLCVSFWLIYSCCKYSDAFLITSWLTRSPINCSETTKNTAFNSTNSTSQVHFGRLHETISQQIFCPGLNLLGRWISDSTKLKRPRLALLEKSLQTIRSRDRWTKVDQNRKVSEKFSAVKMMLKYFWCTAIKRFFERKSLRDRTADVLVRIWL